MSFLFEIKKPASIKGKSLDMFLSMGWYRMGQYIFTSDSTSYYGDVMDLPLRWIRYKIADIELSESANQIKKQNKAFKVNFKKEVISQEIEDLFSQYKSSIKFPVSNSVRESLYLNSEIEIGKGAFKTKTIEIRDQDKLIGAGYCDYGITSVAGILNFYHPNYKKYSLGKYLMLLKIEQSIREGKEYFYPGYIVNGNSRYDYKKLIFKKGIEEYIISTNTWVNLSL